MADFVDNLSDAELRTKLAEYGFPVVPITNTTRKVMTKKLKMLIENKKKINSEGRRSLTKYSSEEESDEDTRTKKRDNRRATMAATMLPPATKAARKSTRATPQKDEVPVPVAPLITNTSVTTETKSRRVTRIIKPVTEEDLETGSDSEPEIVYEYPNDNSIENDHSKISPPKIDPKPHISSPSYSYISSRTPGAQSTSTFASTSTNRYTLDQAPPMSDSNSAERLNQIRSRLSLGNYDKFSNLDRNRAPTGAGDEPARDTPFLSNFSKRLSQLSSTTGSKNDYSYKNDIIKEHDTNGSSFSTRNYLSRMRNRDYPMDFKSSQEKNIFKNNIVSFTLLGIVVAFFIGISVMYMGIRNDQPGIDSYDYVIPLCEDAKSPVPGLNCVQKDLKSDTINLYRVLVPELTKRALANKCTDSSINFYMTEDDIVSFVTKNYNIKDPYVVRSCVYNLHFLIFKNPKWEISVINLTTPTPETNALINLEDISADGSRKNLGLAILNTTLPWKCVFFNRLYMIINSLIVVAIGFALIFGGQKGYKFYLNQRKITNDKIYFMVEKIIDILQTNAADNSDNFLAVNHVRDMLIPPQDRKALANIWNGAVQFLNTNESRIRTEVQIVAGEEFHVWRWLGANLNSTSSPRSKSWQGQAFETQVGSVNSLPCSPTPCLKIRGMLYESCPREDNFFAVRAAVLNKCASKCRILHCEVDGSSGCVYLKCENQGDAAIAYQNLHGWWYECHLVTVKYLRLKRYMQRFPNSPSKGPPFLLPYKKEASEEVWSSDD